MQRYRAYHLDDNGHIVAPAIIISAHDDDDAVRQASAMASCFDVEVWHNQRLIKRLSHRGLRRA
jgi:hypothetical protein